MFRRFLQFMQVFICTMVGCHSIYQGALSLMILAYLHGKQGLQNTKFRNIPFQNVGSFLQVLTIDVVYTMSSYDQFSFYLPSSFFFWCLWCITWKTGPFKILSSETSHFKMISVSSWFRQLTQFILCHHTVGCHSIHQAALSLMFWHITWKTGISKY